MTPSPSSHAPCSPPGVARPITHWALDLAVATGLIVLMDVSVGSAIQLGLYLAGLGFKATAFLRPYPRGARAVRIAYYLGTLPLFWLLSGKSHLSEEWMPVRIIAYALQGGLYLLPALSRSSERDLRRITVVLAGCFFFSAIYFTTPFFLPALMMAAFALFLAFHSLEPAARAEETPGEMMRAASWHLAFTLVGGSLVFFAFPRDWFRTAWGANPVGKGLLSGAQPRSQDMFEVGASSRRDALQFPNLLDWSRSGTEVLRMRMTNDQTGQPFYATNSMYLRASLFEYYWEGNWRSRLSSSTFRDEEDGAVDGWTWVQDPEEHVDGERIRQHIQMSAIDDFCFSLPEPLAIDQPVIKYEIGGILIFPNKPLLSVNYQVLSELPLQSQDPRLLEPSRRKIPLQLSRYLDIPQNLRPVLSRITSQWSRRTNRAVLAEQIRQFLQTQFTYGPAGFEPEEGMDVMRYFLQKSRQGYCTHFASAMALLARSVGLPARVATGFHFGGPPEPDGSYVIRELNAHAWTEIYFPDYGWIIFDATPPSQRPTMQQGTEHIRWWMFLARLGNLTDQLAEYDSSDQKTFLLRLTKGFVSVSSVLVLAARNPWSWASLIGLGLLGWAGFRKLSLRQRRRILQKLSRRKIASSAPFYSDLLWVLARHGHPKSPSLTPQEFANSVVRQIPSPDILEVTRQFYRVKFGGQILQPDEELEIQDRLDRVELALANGKHPDRA